FTTHTAGTSIFCICSSCSQYPPASGEPPGVLESSSHVTATPTVGPSVGVTDWMYDAMYHVCAGVGSMWVIVLARRAVSNSDSSWISARSDIFMDSLLLCFSRVAYPLL